MLVVMVSPIAGMLRAVQPMSWYPAKAFRHEEHPRPMQTFVGTALALEQYPSQAWMTSGKVERLFRPLSIQSRRKVAGRAL